MQVVLFGFDVVVVLGYPVEPGGQQVYFDSGLVVLTLDEKLRGISFFFVPGGENGGSFCDFDKFNNNDRLFSCCSTNISHNR